MSCRALQPREPERAHGAHRSALPIAGRGGARAGAALQGRDPAVPAARRARAHAAEAEAPPHRPQGQDEGEKGEKGEEGRKGQKGKEEERQMIFARMSATALPLAALICATSAFADFNDKKPVTATVTGATPSGYPRTMVEGLNAVVRDAYPG